MTWVSRSIEESGVSLALGLAPDAHDAEGAGVANNFVRADVTTSLSSSSDMFASWTVQVEVVV